MVLVCNHLQMIYEINWENLGAERERELRANVLPIRKATPQRKLELQTTVSRRGIERNAVRLGVK
jgi:hypothetical protein